MTTQIGQLTYTLFPTQADPGMLADNTVNRIVSRVAAETIYPGRGLEKATDSGAVQMVQQTSTTLNLVGFSVLLTAQRPGLGGDNNGTNVGGAVYNVGDMVPVLKRGSMFVEWSGTTQVEGSSHNMYHSSTIATNRGKLTDVGTSAGAGTEIAACPSWVQLQAKLTGSGNIALVDVNAPGAA